MADPVTCSALRLRRTFGGREAALLGWATPPLDDRPLYRREVALLGWATPAFNDWPRTWCGQIGMRDKGRVPYATGIQPDTFQPGCIQVLDSLDVEGNMGTKQDPLSYQAGTPR